TATQVSNLPFKASATWAVRTTFGRTNRQRNRQNDKGGTMPENFALYSQTLDSVPDDQMLKLVDGIRPIISPPQGGLSYPYEWDALTITCYMVPNEEIAEHLHGFVGYVRHIYGGDVPPRGEKLIRRIQRTKLVVGVEINPGRDPEERSDEIVGKLSYGLQPIIFHADALFDQDSRLLLAPDGAFDAEAQVD